MGKSRLFSSAFMLAAFTTAALASCGGDDGGSAKPDAAKTPDAKIFLDAPPPMGLMGLGQKCDMASPCPTGQDCISLGLGGGMVSSTYCTPHCVEDGTGTTNAMGQLTSTTPAPDNGKCSAAYTGGAVGTPTCGVILSYLPMDNPMMANKAYTMIDLGCVIVCGTGMACPTGTAAKTAGSACFCFPN
jgi:hypothetical protein